MAVPVINLCMRLRLRGHDTTDRSSHRHTGAPGPIFTQRVFRDGTGTLSSSRIRVATMGRVHTYLKSSEREFNMNLPVNGNEGRE